MTIFRWNKNTPIADENNSNNDDDLKKDYTTQTITKVQDNLRWGVDPEIANQICNHNPRGWFGTHLSEPLVYFTQTTFPEEVGRAKRKRKQITFFDSNSGQPLFVAPRGRSYDEFIKEARHTGWLVFHTKEVVWKNVQVTKRGEIKSVAGTHLGQKENHSGGDRFVVNLVSIAGRPVTVERAVVDTIKTEQWVHPVWSLLYDRRCGPCSVTCPRRLQRWIVALSKIE